MRQVLWLVPLGVACVPADPPASSRPDPMDTMPVLAADSQPDLPPPGYGTLRQNEFSVELVDMTLHIKVTPLAEGVVRLAAPDTYERLRVLARSRTAEADRLTDGRGAELFLVSFFSREPNVAYQPEELQVTHRGRSLRPAGVIPLTTGWGRQLLQPQQTQSAIYVFEPLFDYDLSMTFRYGLQQTNDWHREVLPLLEEERARVASRAGHRGGI